MSTPTQRPPQPATVVARAGDWRHVSTRPSSARADVAHHITVRVVVDAFHHGGRGYRWLDELQLPAELVDAWLAAGYVRIADDFAINARNAGEIADAFTRNSR